MATNQSVKRLQAVLELLPQEVKAPILAETVRQAQILRGSMMLAVPVGKKDDPHRGRLRDSIRVEQGRTEMRMLVRAGGPTTTVAGYDYALAQEFGTHKMPAHPYFWTSYRARKDGIRKALKDVAKATIKKNWRE